MDCYSTYIKFEIFQRKFKNVFVNESNIATSKIEQSSEQNIFWAKS